MIQRARQDIFISPHQQRLSAETRETNWFIMD